MLERDPNEVLLLNKSCFAGGDDTVGWVLGCLGEFNKEGTSPITHVDIITLYQGVLVG
ncbi:unnamed protein product [Brassica oleracea var. botrytis]